MCLLILKICKIVNLCSSLVFAVFGQVLPFHKPENCDLKLTIELLSCFCITFPSIFTIAFATAHTIHFPYSAVFEETDGVQQSAANGIALGQEEISALASALPKQEFRVVRVLFSEEDVIYLFTAVGRPAQPVAVRLRQDHLARKKGGNIRILRTNANRLLFCVSLIRAV